MTAPAEAREERAESLTSMLLSPAARKIIEVNLPPGVKLERVARAVAKLAHEKPDLLECTGRSIVEAVARGVRFNLELGRFWYLIPHDVVIKRRGHEDKKEKRARFQLDYKGEAAILKRERLVRSLRAACVFENEHFVPKLGTAENHSVEHWAILSEQHRGELVGAYAAAELEHRRNFVLLMTKADIERVQKQYSQNWKNYDLEKILWYCQKSCVHQVWKWLQPDLPEYLRADDEEANEVDGDEEAESIGKAVAPGSVEEKNLLGAGMVQPVPMAFDRPSVRIDRTPRTVEAL
jgi:phage RecT family recombinase